MGKQMNGQFNNVLYANINPLSKEVLNTILQLLFYKLQYNKYAVTSTSNTFAIT